VKQLFQCRLCFGERFQLKESSRLGGEIRAYQECLRCGLISLDQCHWLSASEEKERYLLHQNSAQNDGYIQFLRRGVDPLVSALSLSVTHNTTVRGIDYGCGPEPTASGILREYGYEVTDYDPFFYPETLAFRGMADLASSASALFEVDRFDFVLCTEVIEHLRDPKGEFERMLELLKPGGYLVLMTEVWDESIPFASWNYLSDPTHITFYQPESFRWIATNYMLSMESCHRNVRLFTKVSHR